MFCVVGRLNGLQLVLMPGIGWGCWKRCGGERGMLLLLKVGWVMARVHSARAPVADPRMVVRELTVGGRVCCEVFERVGFRLVVRHTFWDMGVLDLPEWVK